MAASGPQEIKLFGKWSYDDVEVLLTCNSQALQACLLAMVGRRHCCLAVGERHLTGGLHCSQVKECSVCTSHSWAIPEKEVQESTVPHC